MPFYCKEIAWKQKIILFNLGFFYKAVNDFDQITKTLSFNDIYYYLFTDHIHNDITIIDIIHCSQVLFRDNMETVFICKSEYLESEKSDHQHIITVKQ